MTTLEESGFEFDTSPFELELDEDGFCAETGRTLELHLDGKASPAEALAGELERGRQLEAGSHTGSLYGSVYFSLASFNPHIQIGWHGPLFDRLDPEARESFERGLHSAASAARVANALLGLELSERLEESFLLIDGRRRLVLAESGPGLEAWIFGANGGREPELIGSPDEVRLLEL